MAEVRRKKGESFESFFRRFQTRMRQSGKILQAKKIRFHERPPSRTRRRASALERTKRQQLREYLKKIGELPPEEEKYMKKRSGPG